ncbi:hypothetical protein C9374_008230 [Naegleria lovaniensis]|uniref:Pirin n=1 Tax=Naegleria lovaniensis TaxID=51637 RepID=A0AA88GLA3_NAELO|nr:uncharacterized protein C9374_008230 [Naegleria lovaniensis]KAG2378591.1 hypothetical protein C9374_008230 [Naegleria lovaniensis]
MAINSMITKRELFEFKKKQLFIQPLDKFIPIDNNMSQQRPLVKVIKKIIGKEQSEGVGVRVIRTLGSGQVSYHDPFLLLDEAKLSKPAGFPSHPHRGFETVSYLLQGSMRHEDNQGNVGMLGTGDVQWMTAGRGVIHSEMPAGEGIMHGIQLWVNLKAKDKMVDPHYQDLRASEIPKKQLDEFTTLSVIGGKRSSNVELESPLKLLTTVLYFHVKIAKNGHAYREIIPKGYQGLVYVIEGSGKIIQENNASENAPEKSALLFKETTEDQTLEFETASDVTQFLVIAGEPMKEPMARYGPFVMNTQEEIYQAFDDYESGKFQ